MTADVFADPVVASSGAGDPSAPLVVLLVPLLVLGLRAAPAASHWAPYLFALTLLYLPQRLIRGLVPDWVLQYRTLLALLLLYLLWRGAAGVGFHRGDT